VRYRKWYNFVVLAGDMLLACSLPELLVVPSAACSWGDIPFHVLPYIHYHVAGSGLVVVETSVRSLAVVYILLLAVGVHLDCHPKFPVG
jgi:hypothetical protein